MDNNDRQLTFLSSKNMVRMFLPNVFQELYPFIARILIVKPDTPIYKALLEENLKDRADIVNTSEDHNALIIISNNDGDIIYYGELDGDVGELYWLAYPDTSLLSFIFSDDPKVVINNTTIFVTVDRRKILSELGISLSNNQINRIVLNKDLDQWYYEEYLIEDTEYIDMLLDKCLSTGIDRIILALIDI